MKTKTLKDQQKKFCQLWVIDFNLANAWIGAGYKPKTRRAAEASASRFMLSNVIAQKYITKLLKGQEQRAEKSADDIIRELEKVGFSNIKNYLDIEGDEVYFKELANVPDEQAAAVESVKVSKKIIKGKNKEDDVEVQAIQFKLYSKLTALELLGKRYKLFTEKHEIGADEGLQSLIDWLTDRNGGNGDGSNDKS